MLASKYCLKKYKDFTRIAKKGKIFQSDSFGLSFFKREDDEMSLFGFIVSNKISNESTLRNRVKRAMKEAVRFGLPGIKPGFDVVFLAKQKILKKTTEEIMREVKEALKSADLLK